MARQHDARVKVSDRRLILELARKIARRFAGRHAFGLCTVDELVLELIRRGHATSSLGTVVGCVFRTDDWVPTSLRVRSRRPSSHRREIMVWQLRNASRERRGRVAAEEPGVPETFERIVQCSRCREQAPESEGMWHGKRWLCPECRKEMDA